MRFTIILLITIIFMGQNCFVVRDSKDILIFLNEHAINTAHYSDLLATNQCYIYYLKSGEVVMMPSTFKNQGSKGIIFREKACFLDCVKHDSFPIENDPKKIEEKYKAE